MNNMINFYNLFEIKKSTPIKEIISAYKNKINIFNNKKDLNNDDIFQIKLLKIGLYIFINPKLREKYNLQMNEKFNLQACNEDNHSDLDSLFNNNSWINNKTNSETNIGDRVFSLSNLNKRPGFSTDFEISLRNPIQTRKDKTI